MKATQKQIKYAKDLGIKFDEEKISKDDLGHLIGQCVGLKTQKKSWGEKVKAVGNLIRENKLRVGAVIDRGYRKEIIIEHDKFNIGIVPQDYLEPNTGNFERRAIAYFDEQDNEWKLIGKIIYSPPIGYIHELTALFVRAEENLLFAKRLERKYGKRKFLKSFLAYLKTNIQPENCFKNENGRFYNKEEVSKLSDKFYEDKKKQ